MTPLGVGKSENYEKLRENLGVVDMLTDEICTVVLYCTVPNNEGSVSADMNSTSRG